MSKNCFIKEEEEEVQDSMVNTNFGTLPLMSVTAWKDLAMWLQSI